MSHRKSIARDTLEGDFEELLRSLHPSKNLFDVASKMFRDLWDRMALTNQERRTRLKADLSRLESKMTAFVDKMLDTDNAIVSEQIEKRINVCENEKRLLEEKIDKLDKPLRGFDEMFEHSLTFLANPYKVWKNGTYADKRNVLKLALAERLKYSRSQGLRTPKTSIPFKVLEAFGDGQNVMAHPRGFEPLASAFGGQEIGITRNDLR